MQHDPRDENTMYDPRNDQTVIGRASATPRLPWPSWRPVQIIGEGAFGTVYEARKLGGAFDERCAIKHLPLPRSARDVAEGFRQGLYTSDAGAKAYYASSRDTIVKEIQLMQRFSGHSHIVNYHDYEIVERSDMPGFDIYIRMELLQPLSDYLAALPGDGLEEAVRGLGQDVCDALEALHADRIIHRDIKPANILHGKTGFKLADFGVARSLETTGSVTLAGTLGYMAPEIYQHRSDVGYASDLYSLGVMLYRLLNGNRMPFLPADPAVVIDNERANDAFERRMRGAEPLPPISGVSDALMRVIGKACSFSSDDRYPSARAMRAALRGELAGSSPPAPAPAPVPPPAEEERVIPLRLFAPMGRASEEVVAERQPFELSRPATSRKGPLRFLFVYQGVSSHQCTLFFHKDMWYVRDDASTNGTQLLQGMRATRLTPGRRYPLRDGDRLVLGNSITLQAEYLWPEEAEELC